MVSVQHQPKKLSSLLLVITIIYNASLFLSHPVRLGRESVHHENHVPPCFPCHAYYDNRPVFQPDIDDFRYPFTIPVSLEQQLAAFLEQDGVALPLRRPERMPRRGCEPLARGQFEVG
jgi:hypothetical protein